MVGTREKAEAKPAERWPGSDPYDLHSTVLTNPGGYGHCRSSESAEKAKQVEEPAREEDWEKYCRFHKNHGYNTEDCFRLKIAIEKLIKRGHLVEFVTNNRQPRQAIQPLEQQQPLMNINVVFGGMSGEEIHSRPTRGMPERPKRTRPIGQPSAI